MSTTAPIAPQVSPRDVHDVLKRHMLVDGYHLVQDLDRSHGAFIYDSSKDRLVLDFYTSFATIPLGYNHPKLVSAETRERHAIFVGNAASVLITDNRLILQRAGNKAMQSIEGIRLIGHYGARVIVRGNDLEGFNTGVVFEPRLLRDSDAASMAVSLELRVSTTSGLVARRGFFVKASISKYGGGMGTLQDVLDESSTRAVRDMTAAIVSLTNRYPAMPLVPIASAEEAPPPVETATEASP